MSDGMNRVVLLGNLGGDPELRYAGNGTAVLHFRMATNETYLDKNRELVERTEWHSIVVFGPRGEGLSRVLVKGACVGVEGTLRTSSYEKEGQKRYRTEVHAREIYLTSGPSAASCAEPAPAERREIDDELTPGEIRIPASEEMPGAEDRPAMPRPPRKRNGTPRKSELSLEEIPF